MVYISICINVMVILMHTVIVYVHTHVRTYIHIRTYMYSTYTVHSTYICVQCTVRTYSYTYCVRTCFSHGMNVVYFPSQESFDFTSHHVIGSQCHPSNHKVHVRTHIPIVN